MLRRIALTCLLVLPAIAGAQEESPDEIAARLAAEARADRSSFDLVRGLTTDVGQRLAGTDAHRRAVDWAEAWMKSAHLENVHREPFTITAWIRGTETAMVTAPAPQNLAITALGGSVATPPGGIEAEIALFKTYAALLAAPPGSLAGKIAVVTQRMVRAEDGGGYGAAVPIRRKGPSEAAKRGAIAYLHRSIGTDNHRLPHTGKTAYADDAPRIPAAALSNPDADQLERLAARGPVRVKLVLTPTERANAPTWNLVGEVKGREKPDEIVLIGGHLDSWDLGTGATDDGAGVAITGAVAKLIEALPQHPKRTVRVVFFGAEEMDYSGPAYAAAHKGEAPQIALAAEADFGAKPVYAVQLPPKIAAAPFGHELGTVLAPLGAYVDSRPALYGGDDVRELHALGVPVASLRQDGWTYFDTHHTADDTLDKIDPAELASATAAWAAFVYLAAETGTDFRAP
jgi:Zn-dependent M28 family amino/carboxypeptidase